MAVGQNAYPTWNPGKWNQRLKFLRSWSPGGYILTHTQMAPRQVNGSSACRERLPGGAGRTGGTAAQLQPPGSGGFLHSFSGEASHVNEPNPHPLTNWLPIKMNQIPSPRNIKSIGGVAFFCFLVGKAKLELGTESHYGWGHYVNKCFLLRPGLGSRPDL